MVLHHMLSGSHTCCFVQKQENCTSVAHAISRLTAISCLELAFLPGSTSFLSTLAPHLTSLHSLQRFDPFSATQVQFPARHAPASSEQQPTASSDTALAVPSPCGLMQAAEHWLHAQQACRNVPSARQDEWRQALRGPLVSSVAGLRVPLPSLASLLGCSIMLQHARNGGCGSEFQVLRDHGWVEGN
jgi:hypothetical protein